MGIRGGRGIERQKFDVGVFGTGFVSIVDT